ncbi:hypothetical protein Forpi1262_v008753 [Fusarium oxysporum f. sp. raphani]|uniref:Uncharacterized protein n=1 Tax=Fusarium oxysporum f. sp. raphani TaxID=96318 RepID=A0A8J5UM90_FUSOX|nr:hypothetical protein Forpi1262_v008753 [Fusarium oxysporum f. sp. raphani]
MNNAPKLHLNIQLRVTFTFSQSLENDQLSIPNKNLMTGMPDLNSVPPSPHTLAASRRQSSTQMATPPAPASPSLNILPSNQNTVNPSHSPSLPSPVLNASQPTYHAPSNVLAEPGVGPGPGPIRHPRPLTAAELHLQLEKEQEAVVNRLTRELSLLRAAQNASVVSNTSSTSAGNSTHDVPEQSLLSGSGFSIPTARHHRTSSTTSQSFGNQQLSSSYEARIHAPRPSQATPLSRQDTQQPRSIQLFPAPENPPPTSIPPSSVGATPGSMSEQLSPGLMPATMRYEETAYYRNELETAKKENDALKRKIRELERQVRQRRASDASRPRSGSASTSASVSVTPTGGASIAGPREGLPIRPGGERERGMTTQSIASVASVGVGVPEEELKVGESAASAGVAQGQ